MANIQQVLNDGIRRLAKREVKAGLEPLKEQLNALRKLIAEQNKQIKALQQTLGCETAASCELTLPDALPVSAKTDENDENSCSLDDQNFSVPLEKTIRLTKERIKAIRKRTGLTQSQFADLLGVNLYSVSHWEIGKSLPREAQKRKLVLIRGMRKRDILKQLAQRTHNESCPVDEPAAPEA